MGLRFGPDFPKETYIPHAFQEATIDLGEVVMNYAVAGEESAPALLLLPAQAESWWAYEAAMQQLAADYRVYAVDLRGQGRTTRTPGRYTVDNIANDVVRFIQLVIGRPTIVAGNSSGGVVAAWLAAYAPPGLVRAVYLEDAPIFSSELTPACGNGLHQSAVSNLFWLFSTYLGDQWSIGDWEGMLAAAPSKIPRGCWHGLQNRMARRKTSRNMIRSGGAPFFPEPRRPAVVTRRYCNQPRCPCFSLTIIAGLTPLRASCTGWHRIFKSTTHVLWSKRQDSASTTNLYRTRHMPCMMLSRSCTFPFSKNGRRVWSRQMFGCRSRFGTAPK